MLSRPSQSTLFEVINHTPDVGDPFHLSNTRVHGDGSCLFPKYEPLSRAGFSVVQVDPQGNLLKAIYGCVPATMSQDSLSSEMAAISCAFDNCDRSVYVGDCQGIIANFASGFRAACSSEVAHACSWKRIVQRYPMDIDSRILSAVKTKAHRTLADVGDGASDLHDFWGNHHADLLAKEGAKLHQPDPNDVKLFFQYKNDIVNQARHMVDVLSALRLSRIDALVRAPRLPILTTVPPSNDSSTKRCKHNFAWHGKMWVCMNCLYRTSSVLCHIDRPCARKPYIKLLSNDLGHKLWSARVAGGGSVVYCTSCWSYASAYPRKLLSPCVRPKEGCRPCAKFHLANRRHPVSHARLHCPVRLHVG